MKTVFKLTIIFSLIIGVQFESFSQKRTTTTEKVATKKIARKNVTYKKSRKKVVAVRRLSNTRRVINHRNTNIYYDNNRFYRLNGGRYFPIAPSVGLRISVLPTNYRRVAFRQRNYFVHNGIFYQRQNEFYEVVNPEIGTIVYELPDDVEKVFINDELFYEYNNTLYERTRVNGDRAFRVTGFIEN